MQNGVHNPFVRKINALFEKNNISSYRLSHDTGIPEATIGRWRTGQVMPNKANIQKLSEYFNISPDYFFDWFTPSDPISLIEKAVKTTNSMYKVTEEILNLAAEYEQIENEISKLEFQIDGWNEEKLKAVKANDGNRVSYIQKMIGEKQHELNKKLPRFEELRTEMEKFYDQCQPLILYMQISKLSDKDQKSVNEFVSFLKNKEKREVQENKAEK